MIARERGTLDGNYFYLSPTIGPVLVPCISDISTMFKLSAMGLYHKGYSWVDGTVYLFSEPMDMAKHLLEIHNENT